MPFFGHEDVVELEIPVVSGVAAVIPGFLTVNVSNWVKAGGAIAVFVIVYFFSPAKLVSGS